MFTARRIAKNTISLLISQIISYGLNFIVLIFTARYLGAEGFGILSFGLAFTGILGVFTDLGTNTLITREVSRDKSLEKKYFGNLLTIKIILSILTVLLIILIINILNYPQYVVNTVYVLSFFILFSTFWQMFYAFFQAHEKMEYQSVGNILNSILLTLGVFLAINNKLDVLGFALVYLIVSIIVSAYCFYIYRKHFVISKPKFDFNFWKKIIKDALPLSFSFIFVVLAFKIDVVILSMLKGDLAVGYYTASYRLMESLMFFPTVFSVAVFPVLSNFYLSNKNSFKIIYQRSLKYLIILGLPIAVAVTILANKLIILFYGSGFSESVIVLQIIIWAVPILFLTYIFRTILVSINKQVLLLKITFISFFINIILNLILISYLSYIGAAIVTVVTEAVTFIISFYYLSKFINKIKEPKIILNPLIASIIMGLFIICLDINIFALIILSVIIYFTVIVLLKTFSKEDLEIFNQIIKKKN